jgi:hypothetical protein
MHLNFSFSAVQTLWTLTFAALLVLMVVLLGRDRVRRFPWFTTVIVLTALRLLASRLLFGRLANIPLSVIFIGLAEVALLVGFLVLVELARRSFAGLGRRAWLVGTLVLLAVGGGVVAVWGPWPNWKTLDHSSLVGTLQLMQIVAQKGQLLLDLLTVELGLLIILLGDRFHAGWRSHPQLIAIGLSTASLGQMAVQGIWQLIAAKTVLHSRADYDHILDLRDKFFNANSALYVLVVIWWIVSLWIDEPGTTSEADSGEVAELSSGGEAEKPAATTPPGE